MTARLNRILHDAETWHWLGYTQRLAHGVTPNVSGDTAIESAYASGVLRAQCVLRRYIEADSVDYHIMLAQERLRPKMRPQQRAVRCGGAIDHALLGW